MSKGLGIGAQLGNQYKQGDFAMVGKIPSSASVKDDILRSVDLIGGFSKAIQKGESTPET